MTMSEFQMNMTESQMTLIESQMIETQMTLGSLADLHLRPLGSGFSRHISQGSSSSGAGRSVSAAGLFFAAVAVTAGGG